MHILILIFTLVGCQSIKHKPLPASLVILPPSIHLCGEVDLNEKNKLHVEFENQARVYFEKVIKRVQLTLPSQNEIKNDILFHTYQNFENEKPLGLRPRYIATLFQSESVLISSIYLYRKPTSEMFSKYLKTKPDACKNESRFVSSIIDGTTGEVKKTYRASTLGGLFK